MSKHTKLLPAIQALIQSPGISRYLVGITANIPSRVRAYARESIPWVYVLQTGLSAKQAKEIEKGLFEAAVNDKRSLSFRKYHEQKRSSPYRPSIGGAAADQEGKPYAIYVAAWVE